MPNDKEKVYTIKSDIASVSTFADNIDLLYKDLKKKESSFSFGKNNYSEALKELDNLRKITRGYADKGTDLTTEELNECKRELIKVENLTDKYLNERNNSKESSRSTSMRGLKRIITDVKQGIDDEFERIEEEKYYNDENLYKNVADIDKEKIIEVVNDKLKVYHELNPNSEASGNNSFYGEKYKDHNSRVKAGDYSLNRTAGISVSILALAATGKYTVDELMDNSKLVEEKAEMFDKVATAMKNSSDPENQKWIAEQIYNGRNVTEKLIEKEAKTIDYSDPDILNNKKYCQLLHLADAQFDAWQEMSHCEKEIFELAKKDHPEMKSWKDYRDWWTERDSPLLATVQNIRILEQGFQGVLDNVDNISISILDSINMSVCAINTVNRKLNQKQKESPDVPFIEWFETNDKETLASFGAASVETIRKLKFVDDIPSMKKGFLLSSLKGKLSENIEVSIDREKMKMVVTGLPSELEIKKIIVEDNKEIGKQEKAPEVAPAVEEPKAEKAPEVA
ncbi:MAG: hypothetical protein K6F97_07465, partial [Lachnospiraceae bacterium]|nr:hypothetical protein [Lachnospiraceae bacterium]